MILVTINLGSSLISLGLVISVEVRLMGLIASTPQISTHVGFSLLKDMKEILGSISFRSKYNHICYAYSYFLDLIQSQAEIGGFE